MAARSIRPESGGGAPAEAWDAEILRLRQDIADLTAQLQQLRDDRDGAARRGASEGADGLRAKGEEALEGFKASARDFEEQIVKAVREKPVTALAIAAGIGYFLALLNRR